MPTVVQFRRGTTTQNENFTGAAGEISIDTQAGTLRVHNGIDEGGSNIASVSYVTAAIGALSANSITSGTSNFSIIASNGNIRGNVNGATVTNIYAGGMELAGLLSASGNVTGTYIIGNGSQLTGLPAGYANSDVASYLSSGTVNTNILTTAAISATGAVTGSQFNGSAAGLTSIPGAQVTGTVSSATTAGTVTTAAQPNITSVGTLSSITISGSVQSGNLLTTGLISATGTVTGTSFVGIATSARYADLAENYLADANYAPGTVVEFGGSDEVTVSTVDHSTAVAGIVSTDPAYLMNSKLQGVHVVAVALTGRVPCLVQGPVKKGSVLVSGKIPGTAMAINNLNFEPGCVVGKAMEAIDSVDVKTIEVAVGRL